jgi:hypothetical protein
MFDPMLPTPRYRVPVDVRLLRLTVAYCGFPSFLNLIRALRDIFEALGVYDLDPRRQPAPDDGFVPNMASSHLMNVRLRLSPLLSMENDLVQRLGADYFTDAESGWKQVYVRRGWQYIQPRQREQTRADLYAAQQRAKRREREKSRTSGGRESRETGPSESRAARLSGEDLDESWSMRRPSIDGDETILDVSSIMRQCVPDVLTLWGLPDTQALLRGQKLKLSEAAAQ